MSEPLSSAIPHTFVMGNLTLMSMGNADSNFSRFKLDRAIYFIPVITTLRWK